MDSRVLIGMALGTALAIGAVVLFNGGSDEESLPTGGNSTAFLERAPRSVSGAGESPPSVQVVGVMVHAATRASTEHFEAMAFPGTFSKTRLAFELTYPAGGIIDLDTEASELAVFRDDRGTDLRKTDGFFGPFEMMPSIAEDGRSIVITAGSEKQAAPGCQRLEASGTVALRVATDKETQTASKVRLKSGETFEVGPYEFEITETGQSEWSDGWSLTLQTDVDLSPVIRYALVDEWGQEIELRSTMSMSGMNTWTQTLEADAEHQVAGFRIESWKDPETVRIPFELSTGLGLR